MKRPLEILAVAGFRITVGDDSPYWALIHAVDDIDSTNVTRQSWDLLEDDQLLGKDVIICYSWGCASVFMALDRLIAAGKLKTIPLLIIIAGVPRGIKQWFTVAWGGGWTVPDEVGTAVCLQVNSVPVSYPIKNSGPTRVNRLLTGIPGNDHVDVQDAKEAHDYVVGLIAAITAALPEA